MYGRVYNLPKGSSPNWKVGDDGDYVVDDVEKVLINGVEVEFTTGTEGAGGTLNIWVNYTAPTPTPTH